MALLAAITTFKNAQLSREAGSFSNKRKDVLDTISCANILDVRIVAETDVWFAGEPVTAGRLYGTSDSSIEGVRS